MGKKQPTMNEKMSVDDKNLADGKKTSNKPNVLGKLVSVLASEKKEKAKNAIISHPGTQFLFRYIYDKDPTGKGFETGHSKPIPEDIDREIGNWIKESIDNMLNSILSNPLKFCYRQYHDLRFSYSKFEELFKENFWDFYNRHVFGDKVCKIMFQEISKSFDLKELWDLKRVRDIQNFVIEDKKTKSLSEFYTEKQLWKKTYSMLAVMNDNLRTYLKYKGENGFLLYSEFKALFEKTFEKLFRIDPTWWEEVCDAVIREIWRVSGREIDFNN